MIIALLLATAPAMIERECKPNYMRVWDQATQSIVTTEVDLNKAKCEYLKTTRNGYNPKRDLQLQRDIEEMRRQARLIRINKKCVVACKQP